MAQAVFICDSCGREWPERQKKEAFFMEGKERIKKTLCPECLDRTMNEADEVRGVAGDDKNAAVAIDQGTGDTNR